MSCGYNYIWKPYSWFNNWNLIKLLENNELLNDHEDDSTLRICTMLLEFIRQKERINSYIFERKNTSPYY